MSKTKVPCYRCEERSLGCHGRCEKYIAYHKKNEAMRKERQKRAAMEYDYASERHWRSKH